jgi:hypothetical protein
MRPARSRVTGSQEVFGSDGGVGVDRHRKELLFDGASVHTVLTEKELYDGSSGISHRAIVERPCSASMPDELPLDISSF